MKFKPLCFYWNPAKSLKPLDVGLEQDLWKFLWSELLQPIICPLEDIGEVKILQDLDVSEGGSQGGISSPAHLHLLPEVDEAAKVATPVAFLFWLQGSVSATSSASSTVRPKDFTYFLSYICL